MHGVTAGVRDFVCLTLLLLNTQIKISPTKSQTYCVTHHQSAINGKNLTRYIRRCKIPARQLLAVGEPVFYDLYVPYLSKTEKETHLFAVPMLIRNLHRSNQVR